MFEKCTKKKWQLCDEVEAALIFLKGIILQFINVSHQHIANLKLTQCSVIYITITRGKYVCRVQFDDIINCTDLGLGG